MIPCPAGSKPCATLQWCESPCRQGTGREAAIKRCLRWIAWIGLTLLVAGCAVSNPLERLQREFDRYPEYSVILADMREEGTFSTDYWHQYRVTTGQREEGSEDLIYAGNVQDWARVDSSTYAKYQPYLGMVILSKGPDGKVDHEQHPPGYQYVGNDRYGRWRDDRRGGSFWEFYGRYALISHMIGGFGRPLYRNNWNTYRDYRGRGRPYFGSGAYGTNGTVTRQSNSNFFRRQEARQRVRTQGFANRVRGRMTGGSARGLGK